MSNNFYKYGTFALTTILICGFWYFLDQQSFRVFIGFAISIGVLLCAVLVYFLPAILAFSEKHHNAAAIFVLNLFLGWTFLGWVIALVWSFTKK